MDSPISVVSAPDQHNALQKMYGFQLEDGVTFPREDASFFNPPKGKIGIYVKHFDVGYRLSTSGLF